MCQIRNLLHRSAVPIDPQTNMKAAEDFLLLLLHAHTVAAAKELLSYQLTEAEPLSLSFVAKSIINTHLLLPESSTENEEELIDGVTLYARELLTLSLLWHFFHDATKEGDGDRILLSWKIMFPVLKATKHRNYAKETLLLLLQSNCFSERMKLQLLWSRCVNTKGRVGTNVPCDLHMEHLNRRLKTVLRSMGANVTSDAVVRAGTSLRTVNNICLQFEEETCSSHAVNSAHGSIHNVPSFGKDFETLLSLLLDEKILQPQESRFHASFTFTKGLLQHYSKEELLKQIKTAIIGVIV